MKKYTVATWVTEQSWFGVEIEAETEDEAKKLFMEQVDEDPSVLEPIGSKYNFDYDLSKIKVETKKD